MHVALRERDFDVVPSEGGVYCKVYRAANLRMLVWLVYPDAYLKVEGRISEPGEMYARSGRLQHWLHRTGRLEQRFRHLLEVASVCHADRDVETHIRTAGIVHQFVLNELGIRYYDRHVFVGYENGRSEAYAFDSALDSIFKPDAVTYSNRPLKQQNEPGGNVRGNVLKPKANTD